jgi:predicted nucleotidyltransferase component of viral defense system
VKKPANRNVAASVHQRLLNIARDTGRPFNEVLQYFAMERVLYRLSRSSHRDSFILKGALLFRVWNVPDSRATRDIDFLARLDNSPETLAAVFREVCAIEDDDGLVFDPDSVDARTIKEDADYEGVRVRFRGRLGTARITMQVDIGFGDKVHPGAVRADYPVILDLPAPSLRMYPPESVVAEKVEAMVHFGSLNSRMKDFYDVWRLSQQFEFDDGVLREAIRQTFDNRRTEILSFDSLKADLLDNESMEQQWHAFLAKSGLTGPATFEEVLDEMGTILRPALD